MKKIRILLTGGGSGGHIYTLIAVIRKLKSLAAASSDMRLDLRYFGDPGEYRVQLEGEGIKISFITASKLRRYFSILNILDFFKLLWSIPQSLFKIFWFMPDAAFSKSGTGSLPILYACRFYRIPIIIHDSDAIPGLTSRVSGKFAKIIELAFGNAAQYFEKAEKIRVIGNPVRDELIFSDAEKTPERQQWAKDQLDFDQNIPLLLILGGSQGAMRLNNFILENLADLIKKYQILHQIGLNNFDEYMSAYSPIQKKLAEEEQKRYRPVPFLQNDIKFALMAADLIISRAGAGAIFEIAAAGKPSILIPLENSANDHQKANAFSFADVGACIVIEEENLLGPLVLREINQILTNEERLKKMQESANKFFTPRAAENIAKDILSLIK